MIHIPTSPAVHPVFDLAAWAAGAATGYVLYRWRLKGVAEALAVQTGPGYFFSLAAGAVVGAWLAGSLNTLRDIAPTLSHSIAGAMAGAIVAVEIYKAVRGIKGSTGGVFVGSLCVGIIVGRFGCLFSGFPIAPTVCRRPCRGQSIWATELGAIRCSCTRARRWPPSSPAILSASPAAPRGRCGAGFTSPSPGTAPSGSSGCSSSPIPS